VTKDFELHIKLKEREREKKITNLKQIAVYLLIKSFSIATTLRLIKFGLTVPLIVAWLIFSFL
jgi:hypothetical protein